ncbi:MAG: sigma-54-dependent Fis family transcriptional regulator [Phycisphaerae bacterium]|nr:sigma-54-dependent Fis family transcriptional regulator [Phycisphaerae bacterium]
MAKILIIDDEHSLVHTLEMELGDMGHECHCAETVARALEILEKLDPDLAIVDIKLPDGDGIDLIRRLRADDRRFPIVVLTAFASIPSAVKAMREGADDYVEKPVDLDRLTFILKRNLETERIKGRLELYERILPNGRSVPEIIGKSEALQRELEIARRVANPGVGLASAMPTVLITGETGTGKDLLAKHIHAIGPLASQPFVHVDCAALPRELIESELFGHERGAFTDAKTAKRGLLEIATDGSVFLNEIGELALDLQSKLLTMLEGMNFRRVGGTRDIKVNVRIIAATNADLEDRVAEKTFREDLFYRLNAFHIHLPPIRDRGDDILLLAEHFGHKLAGKYHKKPVTLSQEVQEALTAYHWPGNVREIIHVMQRAILLQENDQLGVEHLGIAGIPPLAAGKNSHGEPDRQRIMQAMRQAKGNVSQAARLLGMTRTTLRRRLESMPEA